MSVRILQKNIIFIILLYFFFKRIFILNIYTKIEEDDYIFKNNKYYLNLDLVEKFNSFLEICKKSELIDKAKYPLLNIPKISVIVPVYNGEAYLNYSIRSIQNQKLKEIEIIIIDDCSTDNSLNIINQLMKEDPRIRLIKNYKNRKILYSKSIGALNSKGEYILELDQDDMFIREDLFNIIYNESKINNLDLVQFRDFVKNEFHFNRITRINLNNLHLIKSKKTFYIEQPKLKELLFNNISNYLLWGLLIISKVYKKVIYKIWEFLMNYKIIYNEDYISSTIIILKSQSYKFLNIFGIIHLNHEKSTSFNFYKKDEFHLSNILFPIYLYNYHVKDNPEDIQLIFKYIISNNCNIKKASSFYPEFYEFNLRNILYNNYFLSIQKNEILKAFNISKNQSLMLSSFSELMDKNEFNLITRFQNLIINISNKSEYFINHKININNINNISYQNISDNNSCLIFDINKISNRKIEKIKVQSKTVVYPKISIIIYCNEIKFLNQTLTSIIQQEKFFSFEIIIVYDNINLKNFCLDFEYDNIFILNNLNQKGIMYSFSVGVLASKGQYILNFQTGFTLAKADILMNLYNFSVTNNIDILEFNLLINKDFYINENSFKLYKCTHFNSSLNTNIIKYNKNYKEIDQEKELLINKLIRSEVYKRIICKYKLINYEKTIYNFFDDILTFLFRKNKYIFHHLNIFGVIKNIKMTKSLKLNNLANNFQQRIDDTIFYINFLFDNSKNEYEDKKFVIDEYINKLSSFHNKLINEANESFILFQKFMKCKYIKHIDKLELDFFYKSLIM